VRINPSKNEVFIVGMIDSENQAMVDAFIAN
jgi:hypothetical protein